MGLAEQKYLFYLGHRFVRFLLVSHPQLSVCKFSSLRSVPFRALGPERTEGKYISPCRFPSLTGGWSIGDQWGSVEIQDQIPSRICTHKNFTIVQ